jgi:hypothetical protein
LLGYNRSSVIENGFQSKHSVIVWFEKIWASELSKDNAWHDQKILNGQAGHARATIIQSESSVGEVFKKLTSTCTYVPQSA